MYVNIRNTPLQPSRDRCRFLYPGWNATPKIGRKMLRSCWSAAADSTAQALVARAPGARGCWKYGSAFRYPRPHSLTVVFCMDTLCGCWFNVCGHFRHVPDGDTARETALEPSSDKRNEGKCRVPVSCGRGSKRAFPC